MKNNIFKRIAKVFLITSLAILYISCSANKPSSNIKEFFNYPNPFNPKETYTTFKVSIDTGEIIEAKLYIYSQEGSLVDEKTMIISADKKEATAIWSDIDKNGNYLPSSIYTSKVILKDNQDSIFVSEFKTSVI
ncbi:hypothetical protein [Brachyspira pilosicoli]|uniref:FlgD Ig-like domain-containing protein n=1 Tax=Brachyspira pilosicoli TaxID=52584 RepID=A0A5C8EUH1_BRAPL|nr:hypothetical protein [Brachyspira pilosicoli]TXJ41466.1 hypothetical protein EPJ72_07115 [Brachyspira pilosicoli]